MKLFSRRHMVLALALVASMAPACTLPLLYDHESRGQIKNVFFNSHQKELLVVLNKDGKDSFLLVALTDYFVEQLKMLTSHEKPRTNGRIEYRRTKPIFLHSDANYPHDEIQIIFDLSDKPVPGMHYLEYMNRAIEETHLADHAGRFVEESSINRALFVPLAVTRWGSFHFQQEAHQGHIGGP